MPDRLSIIIPSWNQSAHTINCLRSLRRCSQLKYQVVWIDNGSTDVEHEAVVREIVKHPATYRRFIDPLGFPKAINEGLKLAFHDLIVFLNNDVELMWGWDIELREALRRGKGAAGPMAIQPAGWQAVQYHPWLGLSPKWPIAQIHRELRTKWRGKAREIPQRPTDKHWRNILAFFCTMFNREVFDKVGTLDERFGMGMGDDNDFCYRMRQAGYKLWLCPGALVKHAVSATMNQIPGGPEKLMKDSRRILIEKYGPQRSRLI